MGKEIAVIGIGTQGSMIAFRNAINGKNVAGFSRTKESVDKCKSKMKTWFEFFVSEGKLTQAAADEAAKRIRYAESLADCCKDAAMVIENVPEFLEVKLALFAELDKICAPGVLFSSNTSSLLMSEICANVSAERKKLTFQVDHDIPIRNDYLEMMWNEHTSEDTKKAAIAHYRDLGFEPIITEREIKGYSINRVWRAVKRECLKLWANGYVIPSEFDRGWMMEWHTNIGPFKLMDQIGLDTIWNIEMSYYNASQDPFDLPPQKLKELIEAGHLGQKSGKGFYDGYNDEKDHLTVTS